MLHAVYHSMHNMPWPISIYKKRLQASSVDATVQASPVNILTSIYRDRSYQKPTCMLLNICGDLLELQFRKTLCKFGHDAPSCPLWLLSNGRRWP